MSRISKLTYLIVFICFIGCAPQESSAQQQSLCERWNTGEDPVRCGTLEVPIDWNNPEGKKIQLFYVILPAIGETRNDDPIIFLQGGPGGAATPLVDFFRNTRLRQERDIIIMDQRGTGFSSPQCGTMGVAYFDAFRKDLTPEEEIEALQAASEPCEIEMKENGIPKTAFTSSAIIQDFEALRNELGIKTWNILGASYGSRLGLTYMRDAPEAIRSAVLQGLFPPEAKLYEHLISNLNRTLEIIFTACSSDEDCRVRFPDLRDTFHSTIEQLRSSPYTFAYRGKEFTVNAQDYILMVMYAMYSKNSIENLPYLIRSIKQQDESRLTQALRTVESMLTLVNGAMYMSVAAYEELPFSGTKEINKELSELPWLAPGPAFYISDPYLLEGWHKARALPLEDQRVKSDLPVLLVSGGLDPVTPPSNAESARKGLSNARHIVFESESHSIFNPCYFYLLSQFYNDPSDQDMSDCYQFGNELNIN